MKKLILLVLIALIAGCSVFDMFVKTDEAEVDVHAEDTVITE